MTERIPPVSNIVPLQNHLRKKYQERRNKKNKPKYDPPPNDAG